MKPWEHRLYRRLPGAQLACAPRIYWARETFVLQFRNRAHAQRWPTRMALRQLARAGRRSGAARQLTPRYALGCKRILPTDEWYPALQQPNVELVTDGIARDPRRTRS